jgi:hypothetical protein
MATYAEQQGCNIKEERGAMQKSDDQHGVREAVGVFHEVDDFQAAIDELLSSGFNRAEISILGSQDAVEAKLATAQSSRVELGDNPSTPRGLYVSNESMEVGKGSLIGGLALLGGLASTIFLTAAGGPILVVVLGVALATGAGGLLGTGLSGLLGHQRTAHFQEQLDRGGLLLWVHTRDTVREHRAVEILTRHSGADVHVHGIPDEDAGTERADA